MVVEDETEKEGSLPRYTRTHTYACTHTYPHTHTYAHSQFLMPGLVDTHFHPPEYHRASLSLDGGFGAWAAATMIPSELRFRNLTIAAQQSEAFVVNKLTV